MALSLWLGVVAFTLLYVVMVDRQYRHDVVVSEKMTAGLDEAINQRINESKEMSEVSK